MRPTFLFISLVCLFATTGFAQQGDSPCLALLKDGVFATTNARDSFVSSRAFFSQIAQMEFKDHRRVVGESKGIDATVLSPEVSAFFNYRRNFSEAEFDQWKATFQSKTYSEEAFASLSILKTKYADPNLLKAFVDCVKARRQPGVVAGITTYGRDNNVFRMWFHFEPPDIVKLTEKQLAITKIIIDPKTALSEESVETLNTFKDAGLRKGVQVFNLRRRKEHSDVDVTINIFTGFGPGTGSLRLPAGPSAYERLLALGARMTISSGKIIKVDFSNAKITNKDLLVLQDGDVKPFLESLTFYGNYSIDDTGIGQLNGLDNLRFLSINNIKLSDVGMKSIGELKNLTLLSIGQGDAYGLYPELKITGEGVRALAPLKNLTALNLDYTSIGDDGLKHLKGMKTLRTLQLTYSKVTGPGLKDLPNSITYLDLGRSPITSVDLAHLTNLQHLGLYGRRGLKKNPASITKTSIQALVESNQQLRFLDISQNRLDPNGKTDPSDYGVISMLLDSFPHLKTLKYDSTQMSDATRIAEIQEHINKGRPKAIIRTD